jgi:hypothetical protein
MDSLHDIPAQAFEDDFQACLSALTGGPFSEGAIATLRLICRMMWTKGGIRMAEHVSALLAEDEAR